MLPSDSQGNGKDLVEKVRWSSTSLHKNGQIKQVNKNHHESLPFYHKDVSIYVVRL